MLPSFPEDRNGRVIPALAIGTSAELDGTSASAASAVFDADYDSVVRVAAVGDVRVAVGTSPTAHKIAVLGGKAPVTVMAE